MLKQKELEYKIPDKIMLQLIIEDSYNKDRDLWQWAWQLKQLLVQDKIICK
jgi:hypothetical protein